MRTNRVQQQEERFHVDDTYFIAFHTIRIDWFAFSKWIERRNFLAFHLLYSDSNTTEKEKFIDKLCSKWKSPQFTFLFAVFAYLIQLSIRLSHLSHFAVVTHSLTHHTRTRARSHAACLSIVQFNFCRCHIKWMNMRVMCVYRIHVAFVDTYWDPFRLGITLSITCFEACTRLFLFASIRIKLNFPKRVLLNTANEHVYRIFLCKQFEQ